MAGVPDDILDPSRAWPDPQGLCRAGAPLVGLFEENFAKFAGSAAEFGMPEKAAHA